MNKAVETKKQHPANFLPLELILDHLGASPRQDNMKEKWKLHEKGNVLVNQFKWYNVNEETGGIGGISLLMHALDLKFKDALVYAENNFADDLDWDIDERNYEISSYQAKDKKEFKPPEPAPEFAELGKEYLIKKRGLPVKQIESLFDIGKIYVDSYKNCIFIGNDSAEKRSIYGEFKGAVEGSDIETSGFIVPVIGHERKSKIAITEAAIDALSYQALNPGVTVISSNGSGRFLLHYKIALEAIENGYSVVAAFDADNEGDKAAQKLFNGLYLRKVLSHKLNLSEQELDNLFFNKALKIRMPKLDSDGSSDKKTTEKGTSENENHLFFPHNVKDNRVIFFQFVFSKMSEEMKNLLLEKNIKDAFDYKIKVSEKGYDYVSNKIGLSCDRPKLTKDWNGDWKAAPKILCKMS